MRHLTALFCLFVFGVPYIAHAAPMLVVVYSEELGSVESLEFSSDDKTLVATSYRSAGLYRTSDYTLLDKRLIPKKEIASMLGVGYLDTQTWYFVEHGEDVRAHVRSISPVREIVSRSFEQGANLPVAAKGNYIAFSDVPTNCSTGKRDKSTGSRSRTMHPPA
jgi:hypothetical protein